MNPESFIKSTDPPRDLEETYWWYRARKEIICDTVNRFLAPPGELIDFGCGSGIIANSLRHLGYKVLAADISPEALSACRARGIETLDLKTDWPSDNSADCILACDVLEHVDDDVGLLRKLRLLLRPSGLLLLTVPAYNFLWSGEDYVSNHARRYTRSLLEKNVSAAGFSIAWCSYFNALLLPLVAGFLFYKRLARPRDMYVSDIQPLPEWQNDLLYQIFSAERNLLPRFRFPAGASIILVGRVSDGRPD